MTSPDQAARTAPAGSSARRIATVAVLGLLLFGALWMVVFSLVTSALISAGCCVVVAAASSASDIVEMVLDAIASAILGVFAVIAAIFGALFSLFGL